MKAAASIVVPFLVVAILPAPRLSARGRLASQTSVERTKDRAEKTKDRLSKSGEVITDTWVTARINERFVAEELLNDSDITVDTSERVVTLTGSVTRWVARTKAEKIARRTEGVRQVVNRLTVGSKRSE
jgi:hyperosmotically inducible periplasmic protein